MIGIVPPERVSDGSRPVTSANASRARRIARASGSTRLAGLALTHSTVRSAPAGVASCRMRSKAATILASSCPRGEPDRDVGPSLNRQDGLDQVGLARTDPVDVDGRLRDDRAVEPSASTSGRGRPPSSASNVALLSNSAQLLSSASVGGITPARSSAGTAVTAPRTSMVTCAALRAAPRETGMKVLVRWFGQPTLKIGEPTRPDLKGRQIESRHHAVEHDAGVRGHVGALEEVNNGVAADSSSPSHRTLMLTGNSPLCASSRIARNRR